MDWKELAVAESKEPGIQVGKEEEGGGGGFCVHSLSSLTMP